MMDQEERVFTRIIEGAIDRRVGSRLDTLDDRMHRLEKSDATERRILSRLADSDRLHRVMLQTTGAEVHEALRRVTKLERRGNLLYLGAGLFFGVGGSLLLVMLTSA